MPKADWRSPEPYECLQASDAPTFAWEFLDRNALFHEDVHNLLKRRSGGGDDQPKADFARRWGLRFRRQPRDRSSITKLDSSGSPFQAPIGRHAHQLARSIIWAGPLVGEETYRRTQRPDDRDIWSDDPSCARPLGPIELSFGGYPTRCPRERATGIAAAISFIASGQ